MPEQDRARGFDRVDRADAARWSQRGGAGLGLAIVGSIVEAHGGRVEASSDRHATSFTLFLPVPEERSA